jgi:predicted methyltransferase
LDVVEAERDQWQRPSDVIEALNLKPGEVVVDLGCGSGYFALKLSVPVGQSGSVLAEDIRRLPLVFLWLRTFHRHEHNVRIVHGEPDDPHLPVEGVNAVLIANTYHEFTDSRPILVHVVESLVSGGSLVVIDREPRPVDPGSTGTAAEHHEVSSEQVESELRHAGLEIVRRQDRFIQNDPLNENWWIITARKP